MKSNLGRFVVVSSIPSSYQIPVMSSAAPQIASAADISVTSLAVMSGQATINIGTIGHVAHGKSTVVKGLSGVHTVKFKQEKERNITIKLGYANAKLYRCTDPRCPRPGNYCGRGSNHPDKWTDKNGFEWVLERHVSFVDCPGHDTLMATMLNGAAVMDGALLLVAANEPCPQPQTAEHLAAVEIMKLRNIIVLQNKVELVSPDQAVLQQEEIKNYLEGTVAETAPVIPISAVMGLNLDVVAEYICTQIPVPIRDFTSFPQLMVLRSFDVNKPGIDVEQMTGGVAGGSILKGILRVNDEIEIRPGVLQKNHETGEFTCIPIRTRVVSLKCEKNELEFAVPGSLIAIGTTMDPSLTRADRLVGSVIGIPGHLPGVYHSLDVSFNLMKRLIGAAAVGPGGKRIKVEKLRVGEVLRLNIGSTMTGAKIMGLRDTANVARLELTTPVCTRIGDKVTLSRRYENHWRLIGNGQIKKGKLVIGTDENNSEL
jgi:translation initiation factor 2 subunit 3